MDRPIEQGPEKAGIPLDDDSLEQVDGGLIIIVDPQATNPNDRT